MNQAMTLGMAGLAGGASVTETWGRRSAEALRGLAVLGACAAMTIALCWMALGAIMDRASATQPVGTTQVMAGSFVPMGAAGYAQAAPGRVAPVGTAR